MLYQALEIIKDQVSTYLEDLGGAANMVVLENIAKHDDPGVSGISDKVILSLINLEEEVTLKNRSITKSENGDPVYKNPPIHLNLYLLFAVNRSTYIQSLDTLGDVIEFFQGKNYFNQSNTVLNPANPALSGITEFKFTAELYTPTFEQLNYIWGTLGGKSLPNALYKVTLATVNRDATLARTTRVSQTTTNANPI